MKSVVIGSTPGLDHLEIREASSPVPKSNEVRVRWHATSLNYHDYLVALLPLWTEV